MLAVVMTAVYAVNITTPTLIDRSGHLKGTDFLQFYTAGALAAAHDGIHLYDMNAHGGIARERVPEATGVYYVPVYGPQVALLFAPLTELPFGSALLMWTALSVAIYFACCWVVWRDCPTLKAEGTLVFWLALAFPGFLAMVTYGQISAIVLGAFVLGYIALRHETKFAAGLAFGILAIKPQLAVLATVVFAFAGEWTILAGMAVCAAGQIGLATAYLGTGALTEYLRMLRHLPTLNPVLDVKPFQMHSLRAFWMMLLPGRLGWSLYAACSVAVAAFSVRVWRADTTLAVKFAALVLGSVLVSPHLYVYDLVVLAPALLLIGDWAFAAASEERRHAVRVLLCLSYALPLLGPLARYTHVQFSVMAFALLMVIVGTASRRLQRTTVESLPKF